MAVAKLFPYKVGQRVLWRGKIGTEGKVSTFRPYKVGQRVRLRAKDCGGKIVEGRIYKGGQRALGRAVYRDCDPLPPGDPGVCHGCDYAVVPTSLSASIAGFRSTVGTYPGAPCCNCLAQWERINGTFQLTHPVTGGICVYARTGDSNLQLFRSCSSCLSFYYQIVFNLQAFEQAFGVYRWSFSIGISTGGFGGGGVASMIYDGPLNQCGSVMNPGGTYNYVGTYQGFIPFDPAILPCLSQYPAAVTIG